MQLLDIVIPDPRVGRALYFQAKRNNGYWDANTDFDARLSSLKLGVNRVIGDYADQNPDKIDRTLALIGRAGALYPFFRSSALLRHLDGKTRNVPVVLLYPGERRGSTGLSYMGRLNPDNDYRPRIYP